MWDLWVLFEDNADMVDDMCPVSIICLVIDDDE